MNDDDTADELPPIEGEPVGDLPMRRFAGNELIKRLARENAALQEQNRQLLAHNRVVVGELAELERQLADMLLAAAHVERGMTVVQKGLQKLKTGATGIDQHGNEG